MVDTFTNSGPSADMAVEAAAVKRKKMRWIHVDIVKGGKGLAYLNFGIVIEHYIYNLFPFPPQVPSISLKQVKKKVIICP